MRSDPALLMAWALPWILCAIHAATLILPMPNRPNSSINNAIWLTSESGARARLIMNEFLWVHVVIKHPNCVGIFFIILPRSPIPLSEYSLISVSVVVLGDAPINRDQRDEL